MKQAIIHFLTWAAVGTLLSASHPTQHPTRPAAPTLYHTAQNDVLIAAAADLQFAMDSLISAFSQDNPSISVKATYGSSGNFFAQIANGAPFDLFFSADMDYPHKLEEQHLTLSPVKQYAIGQIVLWSKKLDPAKDQMNSLSDDGIAKIAIANPAHAPYGKRAVESLTYYKLYDKIKDRLVLGENISQAAQYAASGAADIGIIAVSLARSPAMQQQGGKFWLIPPYSHQSMQQGYTVLQHARGNAGAEKFSDFMATAKAVSILKYFGLGDL